MDTAAFNCGRILLPHYPWIITSLVHCRWRGIRGDGFVDSGSRGDRLPERPDRPECPPLPPGGVAVDGCLIGDGGWPSSELPLLLVVLKRGRSSFLAITAASFSDSIFGVRISGDGCYQVVVLA